MSEDLEEMFAEAQEAEETPPVDDTKPDNTEVVETEVPDDVEVPDDDIEPAEEPEDNVETDPVDTPDEPDAELETIIVDGEAVQVTKQELRDGYLRRQDYSRKTAEAAQVKREAEWAKQIQRAFDEDPHGTLKALQDAYGVQPEQASNTSQQNPYEDFDPDVAALMQKMDEQQARYEAELRQVKQQTQEFERRAIVEEVKQELQGLKAEFGDGLNERELLEVAASYNLPLPLAANMLMGRQAVADRKASDAATAKAEAAAKEREAKKKAEKAAGKKVASSGLDGSAHGSPGEISADDFNTLEELFSLVTE